MIRVEHADMLEALPRLAAEGVRVDSVVCDPPYHLTSIVKRFGAGNASAAKVGATGAYARASKGFMGKQWDGGELPMCPAAERRCSAALIYPPRKGRAIYGVFADEQSARQD